jgi:hypothetical protein
VKIQVFIQLLGLCAIILLRFNSYNIPRIATIRTIIRTLIFIFFVHCLHESQLCTPILGMNGFTGTICWRGTLAL